MSPQTTRTVLALAALSACQGADAHIGAFTRPTDASTNAPSCSEPAAVSLAAVAVARPADLPGELTLGSRVLRRGATSEFAATLDGWRSGAGSYDGSLSEFGESALGVADGRATLTVFPKPLPIAGRADRPHWGAELATRETHPHGLFLVRFRAQIAEDVRFSFFLHHDRRTPAGESLGWSGPVLQLSPRNDRVTTIFHDSATGAHVARDVALGATVDQDHVYGIVATTRVAHHYFDGRWLGEIDLGSEGIAPVGEGEDAAPWRIVFTHWIAEPTGRSFDSSVLPVVAQVDWVATYALVPCP